MIAWLIKNDFQLFSPTRFFIAFEEEQIFQRG